jgi:hypothetical protein
MTSEEVMKPDCQRCEGKGWYFRVPDNFNPFLAGGFSTARAMYKVNCACSARTQPPESQP